VSKTKKIPSYRRHRQSGQAVVTLPDGFGGRRDVLLGRYGTKESRQEYARVISEWEVTGAAPIATEADLTINELLALYVRHIEAYYRRADGTPTSEVRNVKMAIRWLRQLYSHTVAREFTSLGLESIRGAMIEAGLCRNRINKDAARIRRLFKWAGAKRLVPAAVFHELATVEGLRAGRSKAKETKPVGPVPSSVVEKTLPFMPDTVADMVRLQMLTGMRSGELVTIRAIDLDTSGAVWHYKPAQHKTAHIGHERAVAIGPQGQLILRRYLKTDLHAPLFSPRESMERFREQQRQGRKTKVQPSQADRKRKRPKKLPGDAYTPTVYSQSILRAIRRANKAAIEANPDHPILIPHWHSHQLRHLRATELRRLFGIDAARVVLGHRSPQITETYAEIDGGKADEIMAKLG
jgi:integrase